ncbi:MAG TPA: cadherin-like domain-containing protein [Luteolibacter sp.]|nr:cadherin-like domain-containing protein [Luteolibacter sp.]
MKSFSQCHPAWLAMLAGAAMSHAATVPEPATIIYGEVLHRTNGHEYRLTEGTLTWTLRDQNGTPFTFTAELEDIKGTFSYRMSIPHQALASGLSVDPAVIPLRPGETRYDFVSIEIDGSPAEVVSSGDDFLKLLQKSRAATHRIDLRIGFDLADTDGDGMPDWWEIRHGLDWQTPDGGLDPDGDGWSNLREYLGGSDPNRDDRVPSLQTRELAAYGESANGVWLRAIDADTPPSDLVFTLAALPAGGELHFDDGSEDGLILETGDAFTQQDLDAGRLTYRHADAQTKEATLAVSLSDGVHEAQEAEVAIHVFAPDPEVAANASINQAPQWWRDENAMFEAYWSLRENVLSGDFVESALLYFMGRNYGWTLWDQRSHTLPVTLRAAGAGSHFIIGGDSDDELTGGGEDDILSGGRGTNRLTGGGGRDLFMVGQPGVEIVTDFEPLEDVLDLSSLLRGKSGSLDSFVQADSGGADTEIRVSQDADGDFSDATIRLEGIALVQDDLHRLWSRGQLRLGAVKGFSSVTLEGWPSAAIEEGHSTARLTVRRQGPVAEPLTVSLSISGSATNGVDYTTLPATVRFAVGIEAVPLTIEPLIDGANEFTEQVNLSLASGTGYVLGQPSGGQVQIIDAQQRFNIVPVDHHTVAGGDPGYLRITRQGPRNGMVELLLSFGGTAVRDVDYQSIQTLVTFSDQQASKLIPVQALALGDLSGAEKSKLLTVSIRPPFEDEYLLGNSPTAGIRLLSETLDFEQWAAESIADADPGLTTSDVMNLQSPRTGLSALLEYASSYGLDLNDGVDPQERASLHPRLARDGGGWFFEFSKRLNDPRLEYVVERSSDMIQWHSDPGLFSPIPLDAASENRGRVRFRVHEPESGPLPYMRVRVTLKD